MCVLMRKSGGLKRSYHPIILLFKPYRASNEVSICKGPFLAFYYPIISLPSPHNLNLFLLSLIAIILHSLKMEMILTQLRHRIVRQFRRATTEYFNVFVTACQRIVSARVCLHYCVVCCASFHPAPSSAKSDEFDLFYASLVMPSQLNHGT